MYTNMHIWTLATSLPVTALLRWRMRCECSYIARVSAPYCRRRCLFSLYNGLAVSVGIVPGKADVVDNRLVTSGTALYVERRKLTAGEPEFRDPQMVPKHMF